MNITSYLVLAVGWWGWSALWLLSARTTESFGLGTSLRQIAIFWISIIVAIIALVTLGRLGLLIAIVIVFGLAYQRAKIRKKIRAQYAIDGEFIEDIAYHLCCPCCTVCQEAREANERNTSVLDYCSGERMPPPSEGDTQHLTSDDHYSTHWRAISMTSKIILLIYALAAILSFIILFATHKSRNVLILLLTFLQPLVILYFVYWRARRQYASLDIVLKMFAVGFWFTTFQSVVLEELIQVVIVLVLGPFIATAATAEVDDNTPTEDTSRTLSGRTGMMRAILTLFSHQYQPDVLQHDTSHWSVTQSEENSSDEETKKSLQSHIVIVIFSLFLMVRIVNCVKG